MSTIVDLRVVRRHRDDPGVGEPAADLGRGVRPAAARHLEPSPLDAPWAVARLEAAFPPTCAALEQ